MKGLLFQGGIFHILKKSIEERPPWDYIRIAKKYVRKANSVLDMGTGGGEKFSLLAPFPKHTIATEGYKLNFRIARRRLRPFGVRVIEADESHKLPFRDEEFDLVLNRHSGFNAKEVYRILRPKGIFLTQRVGGENLKDLIEFFDSKLKWSYNIFSYVKKELQKAGFKIIQARQWKGKYVFKDVGALVYFLKAIPWCVEGFSVKKHLKYLEELQKRIERGKELVFLQTRYLFIAKK